MAWLKVETLTPDKNELAHVVASCGCSKADAFLAWFRLWSYFDAITSDGFVRFLSASDADTIGTLPGLSAALERAGWLEFTNEGCRILCWDRHNGASAKRRAIDVERKRTERGQKADKERTECGPEKEKEKEKEERQSPLPPFPGSPAKSEIQTEPAKPETPRIAPEATEAAKVAAKPLEVFPTPPALDTEAFRALWARWKAHVFSKTNRHLSLDAAGLQLQRLAEWGVERATAAILYSITQGYSGIHEEKQNGNKPEPTISRVPVPGSTLDRAKARTKTVVAGAPPGSA